MLFPTFDEMSTVSISYHKVTYYQNRIDAMTATNHGIRRIVNFMSLCLKILDVCLCGPVLHAKGMSLPGILYACLSSEFIYYLLNSYYSLLTTHSSLTSTFPTQRGACGRRDRQDLCRDLRRLFVWNVSRLRICPLS